MYIELSSKVVCLCVLHKKDKEKNIYIWKTRSLSPAFGQKFSALMSWDSLWKDAWPQEEIGKNLRDDPKLP